MPKRDLLRYWPRQEDVVACVKTDAEASSEAVALAVHQPMRFNRRLIGGDASSLVPCDEHELLRVFIQKNLPDGRVIVPIVGSSGIGKSHVVRWLDTQLRHMEGRDLRVVIRIPKGTSLKGVLGILLKDLQGPQYDQYRQELLRAQAELDVKESAGLLCEMLAQTIEGFGEEAKEKLIENPSDRDADERIAFCRTDMLPTLLRNQVFREQHFVRNLDGSDGVITRLVEQLTEGRVAGLEDDRQHQFRPEDLVFSDRIDRDGLSRAEIRVLSQFDREDRRVIATRILNSALDEAKQRLLRLDPTVSDLFNAVREQLLREQKELVLLIEDFAVLSGIQKQLLQVVIKEAFRDGRQVLCTMRTALAYTTGYMDTATVLTRANVEYRIPDEPGSEEEILARIERLVGAYLNAARFGQSALEKVWDSADRPENWVPRFEASVEHEARATLDEFHSSVDNYDFFPFDVQAIRELSREGCIQHGRLVYNPRFVIQNVINKVLVQRDLFERDQFPPAGFGAQGRPLPARVVEEVKRRVPIGELDRYLGFLAYWCGFPSALSEIGPIGSRVFQAFGLDKDRLSRGVQFLPPVTPPTRSATGTPTSQQENERPRSNQDPIEAKWENLLNAWRGGHDLPQVEANQLRKWVADSLKLFVDWDWDLYRPLKDVKGTDIDSWREHIHVPKAAGHSGRAADDPLTMVAICEDSALLDTTASASIQSALMAVIRFHAVHNGSWDYAGAEADMPRYSAFIEGIAGRARTFVRSRYFKSDWDPIPALVQGLLTGARALGVEQATKDKNHASLIQALFETIPSSTPPAVQVQGTNADTTGWSEFTDALKRCRRVGTKELRDQPSWQGHLLDLVGARQGQADTVHAINVLRLKPAIDQTISSWEFNASLPTQPGVVSYSAFRAVYQEIKRLSTAVPKAQQGLRDWHEEIKAWIGNDFEKDSLYRELKETIEGARDSGIAVGLDSKGLLQLLDDFRNAKVMPAYQDAAKLDSAAPRGLVITILGRDHQSAVRICQQLHTRLDAFLGAIEGELANEALMYGEDPIKEAVNSLTAEAKALDQMLERVGAL